MTDSVILQPIIALAIWTMIMWTWMYATRLPAMSEANVRPKDLQNKQTGSILDEKLPPSVQWKAHNYNHLHEQPTVFYAVAIVLAIIGQGDGMNALLAWIYVGLRITHSLVHAVRNNVTFRAISFLMSSVVLIALIVKAATAVF